LGQGLTDRELKDKIAGSTSARCQVRWARTEGGPLTAADIDALVAYVGAWEQTGHAPDLPQLPPQPTPTPTPMMPLTDVQPAANAGAIQAVVTPTPVSEAPALLAVIAADPINHGAWLYARHCMRCHYDYAIARMGNGIEEQTLRDAVTNGKLGTSMPAFGVLRGGALRSQEIGALLTYIQAWEAANAAPTLPPILAQRIAAIAPSPTGTPPAILLSVAGGLSEPPAIAAAVAVAGRPSTVRTATGELAADAASTDDLRTLWLYCACVTPVFVVLSALLAGAVLLIRRGRTPEGA
jgi:mono/diheme cytochrome c family protein